MAQNGWPINAISAHPAPSWQLLGSFCIIDTTGISTHAVQERKLKRSKESNRQDQTNGTHSSSFLDEFVPPVWDDSK